MKNFNYVPKCANEFVQLLVESRYRLHNRQEISAFFQLDGLVKTCWDVDPFAPPTHSRGTEYLYTLILSSTPNNPSKFLDALDDTKAYDGSNPIFYTRWEQDNKEYLFEQCVVRELREERTVIPIYHMGSSLAYNTHGPARYTLQVGCIPMFKIEDVFELTDNPRYDKTIIQPTQDTSSNKPEQLEDISLRRFRKLV